MLGCTTSRQGQGLTTLKCLWTNTKEISFTSFSWSAEPFPTLNWYGFGQHPLMKHCTTLVKKTFIVMTKTWCSTMKLPTESCANFMFVRLICTNSHAILVHRKQSFVIMCTFTVTWGRSKPPLLPDGCARIQQNDPYPCRPWRYYTQISSNSAPHGGKSKHSWLRSVSRVLGLNLSGEIQFWTITIVQFERQLRYRTEQTQHIGNDNVDIASDDKSHDGPKKAIDEWCHCKG